MTNFIAISGILYSAPLLDTRAVVGYHDWLADDVPIIHLSVDGGSAFTAVVRSDCPFGNILLPTATIARNDSVQSVCIHHEGHQGSRSHLTDFTIHRLPESSTNTICINPINVVSSVVSTSSLKIGWIGRRTRNNRNRPRLILDEDLLPRDCHPNSYTRSTLGRAWMSGAIWIDGYIHFGTNDVSLIHSRGYHDIEIRTESIVDRLPLQMILELISVVETDGLGVYSGYLASNQTFGSQGLVFEDCRDLSMFPSISFALRGVQLVMNGEDYARIVSQNVCVVRLLPNHAADWFILGGANLLSRIAFTVDYSEMVMEVCDPLVGEPLELLDIPVDVFQAPSVRLHHGLPETVAADPEHSPTRIVSYFVNQGRSYRLGIETRDFEHERNDEIFMGLRYRVTRMNENDDDTSPLPRIQNTPFALRHHPLETIQMGIDPDNYCDGAIFVPVVAGIVAGSYEIGGHDEISSPISISLNSPTERIPMDIFVKFLEYITVESSGIVDGFIPNEGVAMSYCNPDLLPPIEIQIGGRSVTLLPTDYLTVIQGEFGRRCIARIEPVVGRNRSSTLGSITFYKLMFEGIIFDQANRRIGFCPSATV